MNRQLVMALYSEGATDNRFLPVAAQRTAEEILRYGSQQVVDVLPVQFVHITPQPERAAAILEAAKESRGYQVLLVHADADNRTVDAALTERIRPGLKLVAEQAVDIDLCSYLVPVIPVTMTEAWMLADGETLRRILGTQATSAELGIPITPDAVERVADPKARLAEILRQAAAVRTRRRRKDRSVGELYEPLGEQINLDALGRLSAYQRFRADLTDALRTLHYI